MKSLLRPEKGAGFYNERVSLCLSVCPLACPNYTKFSAHVTYTAVALPSFGGIMISHEVPVLWMTTYSQ